MKKLLALLLGLTCLANAEILVYTYPCDGDCYKPHEDLGGAAPITYAATNMNAELQQLKKINTDMYFVVISQTCKIQKHTFSEDVVVCTAVTR